MKISFAKILFEIFLKNCNINEYDIMIDKFFTFLYELHFDLKITIS
jgi:hypothetical protein